MTRSQPSCLYPATVTLADEETPESLPVFVPSGETVFRNDDGIRNTRRAEEGKGPPVARVNSVRHTALTNSLQACRHPCTTILHPALPDTPPAAELARVPSHAAGRPRGTQHRLPQVPPPHSHIQHEREPRTPAVRARSVHWFPAFEAPLPTPHPSLCSVTFLPDCSDHLKEAGPQIRHPQLRNAIPTAHPMVPRNCPACPSQSGQHGLSLSPASRPSGPLSHTLPLEAQLSARTPGHILWARLRAAWRTEINLSGARRGLGK